MFVGHLGVALAARRVEPAVPLAAGAAAAFALDLVWPVLLLTGVEVVRVNPGDTAFTNLAFESYPWTHSLAMVLLWSALAVGIGRALFRSWRAGLVVGLLVLSHWVLDWITHRPDLPLWPEGPLTGLGLWHSVPGTILVEGAIFALGLWAYLRATEPRDRTGSLALAGLLVLTGVVWVSQPWAPLPESATAVAWGALVLWLVPPWAAWVERHRVTGG